VSIGKAKKFRGSSDHRPSIGPGSYKIKS